MNDDTEAQEIHGTVVSPEPAADDRTRPSEVTDQDEATDPADEADEEDEERDYSVTDPAGYPAVDRRDDGADEVIDPDAVIIEATPDDEDDEDEDAAMEASGEAAADDEADEDDDEDEDEDEDEDDATDASDEAAADVDAPVAVAGFAREPVASPVSGTADDAETGALAEDEGVEREVAGATAVTVVEAEAVPESDVIPEAARPGVPRHAGVPAMSSLAGDPQQMHQQWSAIQASFVDDPRASVTEAAEFVSEAIAALVAGVQERERALRDQWEREGADTEELRNTLRGYRGLLDQLIGS
jgi:hypothetical protein